MSFDSDFLVGITHGPFGRQNSSKEYNIPSQTKPTKKTPKVFIVIVQHAVVLFLPRSHTYRIELPYHRFMAPDQSRAYRKPLSRRSGAGSREWGAVASGHLETCAWQIQPINRDMFTFVYIENIFKGIFRGIHGAVIATSAREASATSILPQN
jgi:hypothetical protein